MKACDKCKSTDGVIEASFQIATPNQQFIGHGELCDTCISTIVESSGLHINVRDLSSAFGGPPPAETVKPTRDKHPAEK